MHACAVVGRQLASGGWLWMGKRVAPCVSAPREPPPRAGRDVAAAAELLQHQAPAQQAQVPNEPRRIQQHAHSRWCGIAHASDYHAPPQRRCANLAVQRRRRGRCVQRRRVDEGTPQGCWQQNGGASAPPPGLTFLSQVSSNLHKRCADSRADRDHAVSMNTHCYSSVPVVLAILQVTRLRRPWLRASCRPRWTTSSRARSGTATSSRHSPPSSTTTRPSPTT